MRHKNKINSIHIRDPECVALVSEQAKIQNRSAVNMAETILISSLNKKPKRDNALNPDFLDKVHCKDNDGEEGSSSGNNEERLQKTA
jgi:hypothetical protein